MSEDPMGFAAGDNNLFRYCGNDPMDRTDPNGDGRRIGNGGRSKQCHYRSAYELLSSDVSAGIAAWYRTDI